MESVYNYNMCCFKNVGELLESACKRNMIRKKMDWEVWINSRGIAPISLNFTTK